MRCLQANVLCRDQLLHDQQIMSDLTTGDAKCLDSRLIRKPDAGRNMAAAFAAHVLQSGAASPSQRRKPSHLMPPTQVRGAFPAHDGIQHTPYTCRTHSLGDINYRMT